MRHSDSIKEILPPIARRIAALLALADELDANYRPAARLHAGIG